jgi:hypothetical protein
MAWEARSGLKRGADGLREQGEHTSEWPGKPVQGQQLIHL